MTMTMKRKKISQTLALIRGLPVMLLISLALLLHPWVFLFYSVPTLP